MGLKSNGANGFKAFMRTTVRGAFRSYDSLQEVRDAVLKRTVVDPEGGEEVTPIDVDVPPPLG